MMPSMVTTIFGLLCAFTAQAGKLPRTFEDLARAVRATPTATTAAPDVVAEEARRAQEAALRVAREQRRSDLQARARATLFEAFVSQAMAPLQGASHTDAQKIILFRQWFSQQYTRGDLGMPVAHLQFNRGEDPALKRELWVSAYYLPRSVGIGDLWVRGEHDASYHHQVYHLNMDFGFEEGRYNPQVLAHFLGQRLGARFAAENPNVTASQAGYRGAVTASAETLVTSDYTVPTTDIGLLFNNKRVNENGPWPTVPDGVTLTTGNNPPQWATFAEEAHDIGLMVSVLNLSIAQLRRDEHTDKERNNFRDEARQLRQEAQAAAQRKLDQSISAPERWGHRIMGLSALGGAASIAGLIISSLGDGINPVTNPAVWAAGIATLGLAVGWDHTAQRFNARGNQFFAAERENAEATINAREEERRAAVSAETLAQTTAEILRAFAEGLVSRVGTEAAAPILDTAGFDAEDIAQMLMPEESPLCKTLLTRVAAPAEDEDVDEEADAPRSQARSR